MPASLRPRRPTAPRLYLAAGLLLASTSACEVSPADETEPDASIVIPDASSRDPEDAMADAADDAGDDAAALDATVDAGDAAALDASTLCDFPPVPPRLPAVASGERACSQVDDAWPACLPSSCSAADFGDACRELCEMTCERERWFCTRDHCDSPADGSSYCESQAALTECTARCGDDVGCLNAACDTTKAWACSDAACPEGEAQLCDGLTCDNSCTTAFDGECDDGSPINAAFQSCELGTDCADCGARAACFALGAECFSNTQCCGFESGDAYCVNVGSDGFPLGRCLADCSEDAGACQDGTTCLSLASDGSDAREACFPFCAVAP